MTIPATAIAAARVLRQLQARAEEVAPELAGTVPSQPSGGDVPA